MFVVGLVWVHHSCRILEVSFLSPDVWGECVNIFLKKTTFFPSWWREARRQSQDERGCQEVSLQGTRPHTQRCLSELSLHGHSLDTNFSFFFPGVGADVRRPGSQTTFQKRCYRKTPETSSGSIPHPAGHQQGSGQRFEVNHHRFWALNLHIPPPTSSQILTFFEPSLLHCSPFKSEATAAPSSESVDIHTTEPCGPSSTVANATVASIRYHTVVASWVPGCLSAEAVCQSRRPVFSFCPPEIPNHQLTEQMVWCHIYLFWLAC